MPFFIWDIVCANESDDSFGMCAILGRMISVSLLDDKIMKPTTVRTESVKNAILVASYGTFAVGVNVRRLHHLVFASPSKSRYRVLQSIGRGLRLHPSKRIVYVMDVIDDLRHNGRANHLLNHWAVRSEFYRTEQFPLELYAHSLDPEVSSYVT